MNSETFDQKYKALNPQQREAVDSIDGPVMVIAGPGTGKTQILTLRIANILVKTDTPASGILALTFTNSGVRAMRERLTRIIGSSASHITISTFHSFGISLIKEFFEDLSLPKAPALLDDKDRVILFDELLENHDWEYLRPRSGGTHNFDDLKSLISFLKKERMNADDFSVQIDLEIKRIQENPESISSRGPTKGQMKATEKEKIERLERTKETAKFYELYEKTKKERSLADYDDVLEYIVELVKRSENARASIRERYLYVLVDEHQDSSGVQNEFLEEVWAGVEKPNVFVVGDDRQLIYGFGGASLSHFEKFREVFVGTNLIVLSQNYRSTQNILDVSGVLLQSSLVKEGLQSVSKESHPIRLIEAQYPRDEILKAGLEIRKKIKEGVSADEFAIIVPKKAQERSAIAVLKDLGLSVASGGKSPFFPLAETQSLIAFLRVLVAPYDASRLSTLLLDGTFGVPFLTAQKFLREYGYRLSLESFEKGEETIKMLGKLVAKLAEEAREKDVYSLIQQVVEEIFFKKTTSHKELLVQIEVVRTMLHLALQSIEKNHKLTLEEFITFIERLEEYGQDIPLAVFSGEEGVKVMTLHASKGLEFEYVWIAHLDEGSLMRGKQLAITLPESLKEKLAKKDEITAKRELYVGITRARKFCTLSYACSGYAGTDQKLAKIVAEMPQELFEKKTAEETEKEIRAEDEMAYVLSTPLAISEDVKKEITDLVKAHFADSAIPVTHLNNFFSCPWKWYFRNFIKLPEPETESLQFGNLIHGSIEKILKEEVSDAKAIPAIMDEVLDSLRIYNERLRERFSKEGKAVLVRFMKNSLKDFSGARSEKKANAYRDPEIPKIEVSGKIDLIQTLSDGTLSVTDFKTGKVKTVREIEKIGEDGRMSDFMRQLAMYSYLLMHEKDAVRVSNSVLLFLEAEEGDKNAVYRKTIGNEEIELLRTDLKDFVKHLESGEWIDLPCSFKPFGRQKEC